MAIQQFMSRSLWNYYRIFCSYRCTWHIVSMDIDESSLIIQQLLPWLPAMSQFYASLRVMEQRHSVTVWIWDSLTLCLSGILLRKPNVTLRFHGWLVPAMFACILWWHVIKGSFHGGNSGLWTVFFSIAQRSLSPVGTCLRRSWSHIITSPEIIVSSWHMP